MGLATALLAVGLFALGCAGLVLWLQLVQPVSKQARLPLMIVRVLIGLFALVGMGYAGFLLLFTSSNTVTVCDPTIPISEDPCQTIETRISTDSGDGIYTIHYAEGAAPAMRLTGCDVNWNGNPWGDSTPCKNAETGQELIAVIGPRAYHLRWE